MSEQNIVWHCYTTGSKDIAADVETAQQLANEAAQSGDNDAKNLLEVLSLISVEARRGNGE